MKKSPKLFTRPGKSNITLKNVLNNLRDNDLHSENKQITQCVFLGVLKLKPVPSIFYSNNSFSSAPLGRKLRIIRNRNLSKDTSKNPAKSIINKVISGRISKKNPETVKASIKKISPKRPNLIIKLNMNNQPTAESSDLSSVTLLTPEKVFSSQVINLNSLTTPRQFNPVQNLFDKVKQQIGDTQSTPSLSSADFEVNPPEPDSNKKSKTSPKRNSKKKPDSDNNEPVLEVPLSETKQKERSSPRNKKSVYSDTVIISDDVTAPTTSQVTEVEVINLIEDSSLSVKNSATVLQQCQDTIDLTGADNAVTEKPKPRRGRLLPTAIPSIFLTAPRLLRSELAQKKPNSPEQQKFREKITRSKIIIKTKSSEAVSSKPNKDKKVTDHEIVDDDILFVSEEVKSPNDGDKPSLKLLIRQKKKSEMVAQESTKQSDIQEVDLSSQNPKQNEPETPQEVENDKIREARLLRSAKQKIPTELEIKDQEDINVSSLTENANTTTNIQENIELESEKPTSITKNESNHNLKVGIKDDEEGLDVLPANTSAITENNNFSKTVLEQLSSNINSDSQLMSAPVNMDEYSSAGLQESSNKSDEIIQLDLSPVNEKDSSSEGNPPRSVTRSLRSNPVQNENKTEETIIIVDKDDSEDELKEEEIPTTPDKVISQSVESSEKKLRRSQRSQPQNSSEINSEEVKVDKISPKIDIDQATTVPQDSTDVSVNEISETPLRKSVRSVKFRNVENNNCDKVEDDKEEICADLVVQIEDSLLENNSNSVIEVTNELEAEKHDGSKETEKKVTKTRSSKGKKVSLNKKLKISDSTGRSQKRKSINDKYKGAKQKKVSSDNSNDSELVNISSRSLRSKPLPHLIVNIEISQGNKENKLKKSKTKSLEKNKVKTKYNVYSNPKNVLVQPSTSNVQSTDSKVKSRSTNRTSKVGMTTEVTTRNKKKNTVEQNAKITRKTNMNETKKTNVKEVSVKRQKTNVKIDADNSTAKKIKQGKSKANVKQEKQNRNSEKVNKPSQSKKVLASKDNVTKNTKLTVKNKDAKMEANKNQSIGKTVVVKLSKASIKGVIPKSLKSKEVLVLNKNKPLGNKKNETKKSIKIPTRKTRFPLKVQNIISTRSRGIITVKDKKVVKGNKEKAKIKPIKKSNKIKPDTNQSSSSTKNQNTSKLKQNKLSLNKTMTRGANKKLKLEESNKSPIAIKSKNIHKAKSLLLRKKKLLIERIIKSTLKRLDVQKQMRKSKIKLKAKAQLQRKRNVQNIIKAAKSTVENASRKDVPVPSTVLSTNIVQADSSVIDLQDQNETIIFLATDENCIISELPVIENIPENIICLEVNDTEVKTINKTKVYNVDNKTNLPVTRRSSRIVRIPDTKEKSENIEKPETSSKRKRKLEVVSDVPVSSSTSQNEELQFGKDQNVAKIRKVDEGPGYEDLAEILTASEAVLRNIEQVTNLSAQQIIKKKPVLPKGKDLTIFDFNESDPEPETVPLRFKVSSISRTEEQPSQSTDELSPDQTEFLSPKKSPMKQATILEMFNRMDNKNQKFSCTAVKSIFTSTPKALNKKLSHEATKSRNSNGTVENQNTDKTKETGNENSLEEQLTEFKRKCLKIEEDTTEPGKVKEATVPPAVFRGLQRICLKIHNTSVSGETQSSADKNSAPEKRSTGKNSATKKKVTNKNSSTEKNSVADTHLTATEEPAVISTEIVKTPQKIKPPTTTFDMPPPTKVKVMKKATNPDQEELFDDDDSRSEWMPQELAEYKFNYSAKKVMSYKPVFKCKVCLAIYPTYYKLTKHKQKHIETQNPYACRQCEESFKNVEDLVAHIRVHKGQHPYVCQKCDSGFPSRKAFEAHLPVHLLRKSKEAPKKFECDICKKKFAKLCDIERHSRVHTGEKPFICNICNKRFQQTHNLSKHLLIHLHLKPFNCEICGKKFGRVDVLNRHVLTHSLIKPFKCCLCPKDFIRISQLNHHYKREHPDYVNTELASQFVSSSDANATESADICDQESSSRDELIAELEVDASDTTAALSLSEDEVVDVLS